MKYDFSICTPVYNRAPLLPRLYKSLLDNMHCEVSYEWILIDDGSTDNIDDFVKHIKQENKIEFTYIKKKNGGKHTCLNVFFKRAAGELTLILDSDDMLADKALIKAKNIWVGERDKEKTAGIIGLCSSLNDGKVLGDTFPNSPMKSTLIANSYALKMKGDRCDFIRSDLLSKKSFPLINDENFMPEAVVMIDFDIDYKYLCVNDIFKVVEYQDSGLSENYNKIAMKNPLGMILRFEKVLNNKELIIQADFISKLKFYGNYFRYVLHSYKKTKSIKTKIRKFYFFHFVAGIFLGTAMYFYDVVIYGIFKR